MRLLGTYISSAETGLYYLQSRYYDPTTGRFINADAFASTGQGLLGNNMFAYCLNNPVNYCDESGNLADSYAGWFGELLGELLYEWITEDDHPSHQTRELEIQVRQKQNEHIGKGFRKWWEAYVHSVELSAERQYRQDMVVQDHKAEIVIGISAVKEVSGATAVYCGLAAAELAVPTFGISVPTMGKIAAVAAAVSWLSDKLLELIN